MTNAYPIEKFLIILFLCFGSIGMYWAFDILYAGYGSAGTGLVVVGCTIVLQTGIRAICKGRAW